MKAFTMVLAGGAGLAALVSAAPAAAQYYPQPGYGYNNNVVGQIIGQVLGYGRYPYGNYGYNQYGAYAETKDPPSAKGQNRGDDSSVKPSRIALLMPPADDQVRTTR